MGEIALSRRDLRESSFVAGRFSSDEHLARMASRGNARAFAVLYERHHQSLFRYCRSIVRQPEDALDALQSTMTRAFAALCDGERDLAVRAWLFRIAHNESISILRRRSSESIVADEQPGGFDLERTVEQRERLTLLVADLQTLVERQRAALVMRELSGLSIEEIAGALSCSAGAAKQALFEARTALQEMSEGRAMDCEVIRRAISEHDGRVLRGRKLRAHLRACPGCRDFQAAIGARRADLQVLVPPLPPVAGIALLRGLLASGPHGAAGTGAVTAVNNAGGATVAGTNGSGVGFIGAGGSAASTGASGTMLSGHLVGSLAAKVLVGAAVVATAATGVTHFALGLSRSRHPASSSQNTNSPDGSGTVMRAKYPLFAVPAPELPVSPYMKVHAAGTTGMLGASSSGRHSSFEAGHAHSAGMRGDLMHTLSVRGNAHDKGRAIGPRAGTGNPHRSDHAGKHGSPSAGKARRPAGKRGGSHPGEQPSEGGSANAQAHRHDHLTSTTGTPSPSLHPSSGSEGAGAQARPQPRGQSPAPVAAAEPRQQATP